MAAFLPHALSALGSIAGGLFSRKKSQETPVQGNQRELIDMLLASIQGQGPFSDLFNLDEEAFQKSYVDPAKQMFSSQIAPQIQQSYISGGQQRGTGIEDTLARAGVDMDQLLNQQYMQFQQQGQQRALDSIGKILGQSAGAAPSQSFGSALGQSVGGYLSGDSFTELIKDISNRQQGGIGSIPGRKGYAS